MTSSTNAPAVHRDHLRRLSAEGGPLREGGPNATTANREWFRKAPGGGLQPTSSRNELHQEILTRFVTERPDVVQGKRCIVLAGPPGAGKSTTLKTLVSETEHATWRVVDADHFKEVLLRQAQEDGSYHTHLVPAEVRELEERGERFFPLELASLVHKESSILAHAARRQAIERGDNLIIDTVLSSPESARRLGAELEAAGYQVSVVDVETTFETSEERIAERWERGYVDALESDDDRHLGGRWVPSEYPRTLFVAGENESRSAQSARLLTDSCGAVISSRVYTSAAERGQPAQLRSKSGRVEVGGPLLEGQALKAARAASFAGPSAPRLPGKEPGSGSAVER